MKMREIISAEKNGPSYWSVIFKSAEGMSYKAYLHETEYELLKFENALLQKQSITEEDLDTLGELHHDVEFHNRCMEE